MEDTHDALSHCFLGSFVIEELWAGRKEGWLRVAVYFYSQAYCAFWMTCAMTLSWCVVVVLSTECRVVKSTSYTKIASSSRRSTTKSPGPSRRSKSPASTSSGKASSTGGFEEAALFLMVTSRGCEGLREYRFQFIILEHFRVLEQICQCLTCWL